MWPIFYDVATAWLAVYIPLLLIMLVLRRYNEAFEGYFGFNRVAATFIAWLLSLVFFLKMGAQHEMTTAAFTFFKWCVVMAFISIIVFLLPIRALRKH